MTERPKLRAVEAQWISQRGKPALFLHDRLALCDRGVVLPAALAPLLPLIDGTRDIRGLQTAFELRFGTRLPTALLEQLIGQFDEALLLEGPGFTAAYQSALDSFRAAPYREPALAGQSYPAEGQALEQELKGYLDQIRANRVGAPAIETRLRGVVIPHIDYQRGGTVYAQVWERAERALQEAELVVIFGTDHNSAASGVTLTRQHYATPWGTLPTAREVVDSVAEAIGSETAFAGELHHRREHSIELAVVWLHYLRRRIDYRLVPILCGSFQPFLDGAADPSTDATLTRAIQALRDSTNRQRTFVVAAADLAHVGPAFGDSIRYGPSERASLATADNASLQAICSGNPDAFFQAIREERDRRRICGLAPIYLTLRLLGDIRGEVVAYAQCPADAGDSLVSVAGVLLS
ncbi:MAG: AmmeMemoRadiSam system protein B [Chloroflexota bacterium]